MQKTKLNQRSKQIKVLENELKRGKLSKNEYIRVQALLLRKKGFSHKQIMEITGKSHDAIKEWITSFNKDGILGLKDKPVTKPRNYKLTKEEKNQIKTILKDKRPGDLGFPGEFWCLKTLRQLIKQKFNVVYRSATSYRKLFDFCGFSYQKVKFQDSRKDEEKTAQEKVRLEKRVKRGVLRIYW